MATADVMMYDDVTKQWLSPDGSSEPARSQVRILHNVNANTFRIVGTRLQVGFRLFCFLACLQKEKAIMNPFCLSSRQSFFPRACSF